MITTTILAIVESFLATLAYAVLFQCTEAILYSMWNYRYGRVAFVSGNVSGDNCGIGVLCRNIGSSIDFQDFDGTEKMPDYDIFGFGIIPLVPGAGIYYTAYYLVTGQMSLAAVKGLEAVKIAFAIVLGIIFVVSIPRDVFRFVTGEQRESGKG